MELTEQAIKKAFKEVTEEYGASTKLGLSSGQLHDFKRRPNIKTSLYVLWKAGKLKLEE